MEKKVMCAASAYEKKYYLAEEFSNMPSGVKDELQIMCVLFTEEVGGILSLVFDEEGKLFFEVTCREDDLLYDEIGSGLKIKQLVETKKDLLEGLEMYYKVMVLKKEV